MSEFSHKQTNKKIWESSGHIWHLFYSVKWSVSLFISRGYHILLLPLLPFSLLLFLPTFFPFFPLFSLLFPLPLLPSSLPYSPLFFSFLFFFLFSFPSLPFSFIYLNGSSLKDNMQLETSHF